MKTHAAAVLLVLGGIWTLVGLPGCIRADYIEGSEIRPEDLAAIEVGRTTKREIIERFGPANEYVSPTVIGKMTRELFGSEDEIEPEYNFSDVLTYQYSRGKLEGLFLIVYNWFEIRAKSDRLVIFFDDQQKVRYFGFRRATDDL